MQVGLETACTTVTMGPVGNLSKPFSFWVVDEPLGLGEYMSFVFFISAGYPLVPKTISELHLVNEDCYELRD